MSKIVLSDRLIQRCWVLVIGILMAGAPGARSAEPISGAQQTWTEGAPRRFATAPAWSTEYCSPARSVAPGCRVEQRLLGGETGQLASFLVINIPGARRKPRLRAQIPPTLWLPDGVSAGIDGASTQHWLVQSCDGSGCYAEMKISPDFPIATTKGKLLTIKATAASRASLILPYLLTDFTPAYDAA